MYFRVFTKIYVMEFWVEFTWLWTSRALTGGGGGGDTGHHMDNSG